MPAIKRIIVPLTQREYAALAADAAANVRIPDQQATLIIRHYLAANASAAFSRPPDSDTEGGM